MIRFTYVIVCPRREIRGYFRAPSHEAADQYAKRKFEGTPDATRYYIKKSPLGWGAKL